MPELTLQDRIARHERVLAMRQLDPPMTFEEIGRQFKPRLSKERVRQILAKPPQAVGRPHSPQKRAELQRNLRFWEQRRANRLDAKADTSYAEERIAAITAELAGLS